MSAVRALVSLSEESDIQDDAFEYLMEFLQDFGVQPEIYYNGFSRAIELMHQQEGDASLALLETLVDGTEELEYDSLPDLFAITSGSILSLAQEHHKALVHNFVSAACRLHSLEFSDGIDTSEHHAPIETLVLLVYLSMTFHGKFRRNMFLISTFPLIAINPQVFAPLNAMLTDLGDGSILGL